MQQTIINVKEKCSVALDIVGEQMEIAFLKTRNKSKRAYKYVTHKSRIKSFLSKRLDEFSEDHSVLFSLIENGEVKDKLKQYEKCKHNITSTLKATKALRKQNLVNAEMTETFITEYLRTKRFDQRYKAAY
jgi:hypothetical protein